MLWAICMDPNNLKVTNRNQASFARLDSRSKATSWSIETGWIVGGPDKLQAFTCYRLPETNRKMAPKKIGWLERQVPYL